MLTKLNVPVEASTAIGTCNGRIDIDSVISVWKATDQQKHQGISQLSRNALSWLCALVDPFTAHFTFEQER